MEPEDPEAPSNSRIFEASIKDPDIVVSDRDGEQANEEKPAINKTVKLTFDPFKIPPSFPAARAHSNAKKVANFQEKMKDDNEDETQYCPCCYHPFEANTFPLCASLDVLGELGEGFPLYYHQVKWVVYMFLVAMLVSGVYCLNENYEEKKISEWDDTLDGNMIMEGSLANFGRTGTPTLTQPWLHVGCMWLFLLLHSYLLQRHKRMCKAMDKQMITPSDYTCQFSKLPRDLVVSELIAFIERNPGMKVSKVNLAYDIRGYAKNEEALIAIARKKCRLEYLSGRNQPLPRRRRCLVCRGAEESVAEQEAFLTQARLAQETIKNATMEKFVGVAYVTFEQDEMAKGFAEVHGKKRTTGARAAYESFCGCLIRHRAIESNIFKGVELKVKRAPEPDDILWENLGVPPRTRKQRRYITTFATIVLLLACAGVIYGSSVSKEAINDKKNSTPNPSAGQNLFFSLLIFLPSILVVVINMALGFTIRKFSKLEMHKTVTDYDSSVASKLTVSMFINTAVVAIAYHWGKWYEPAGLTQEVYNILIANAIVQPLLTIFSPAWFLKKLQQFWAARKNANSLLTQQEANDLFEGMELDMAQHCASFMKTYLLTIFYAPILPLAYPLGVLALVLQYCADKFMLLRVYARPDVLSNELDDMMLRFLSAGTVLYAATNMLFFFDFTDSAFVPGIVGLVTTFAYNIFPVQRLIKALKCIRKNRRAGATAPNALPDSESPKTYEEAMIDFVDDYDRTNPVTMERGKAEWRAVLRKKRVAGNGDAETGEKQMEDEVEDVGDELKLFRMSTKTKLQTI